MSSSKGRRGGKLARNRLTYANVISTLAIFIALGGSSYAAMTLPTNSVGAAQIRAGAVGSSEIRNGSIQASDVSATLASRLEHALVPQHLGATPTVGSGATPTVGSGATPTVGTTPFIPPRSNNACKTFEPHSGDCTDISGPTKTLGFLDSYTWTINCGDQGLNQLFSKAAEPVYTLDTTSGAYSGVAAFAAWKYDPYGYDNGFFTATNWTWKSHTYTPHTACHPLGS